MRFQSHRNVTDNIKTFQIIYINELLLYLKLIFKNVDVTISKVFLLFVTVNKLYWLKFKRT